MRTVILVTIILCVSFLSACNNSKLTNEKQNSEINQEIKITDSQERTFYSKIYNHDITVQVYLPMGYNELDTTFKKIPALYKEPRKSYPVLYLLDSDVYFGMASVTARLLQWENKLPGVIIAGVSYGLSNWWDERQHDYYPFHDTVMKVPPEASKYLEMYEKELIPYIESNFKADAGQRILFGHSAGGNLTLYSLFSKPELFHGYISASLSTRYLPEYFSGLEKKYSGERNDMPAKLFLTMGALEQKEGQPEWQQFINTLKNRDYKNLNVKNIIIEDESHLSSAPISLVKGLEWYFSKN